MSEDNNCYINSNKKQINHKKPLDNKKFSDDFSDEEIEPKIMMKISNMKSKKCIYN